MSRWRMALLGALLALSFLLGGCYLVSGEQQRLATPAADGAGEIAVQFVSADGRSQPEYVVGSPVSPVQLEVLVSAEQGDLTLEILDADLSTVLTVAGRYGLPGRGSVVVRTDGAGRIKFRVIAVEVRNGAYTIRYRPPPAAPTPTPSPLPGPTP